MNVFLKPIRELVSKVLASQSLLFAVLVIGSSVFLLKGLYIQSGGDMFDPPSRPNKVSDDL